MGNMNLSNATKDDFIEFVAATYFRVQAILQALYALQGLVLIFVHYFLIAPASSSNLPMIKKSLPSVFLSSVTSCISDFVMVLVFFFLAVPLAHLIRRSLCHALETTTTGVASKAGLIEPLIVVLFRALAVSLILGDFFETLSSTIGSFLGSFPGPWWMTATGFLVRLPIPIILFVFSLPFARMLSNGLSRALSSNPANLVNPV